MKGLYYPYMSVEALEGFSRYKYCSKDTNPLSIYILHPIWNRALLLVPKWVAPNLLTLIGFLCCIASYVLPCIYDYHFTSSLQEEPVIPSAVWFMSSVLLFLSHTLDGLDGKQARRTGSSSPLGELFDHGCDSWAAVFITCTFYDVFGINDEGGYSISPIGMFQILWLTFFNFYFSHWEKYNTCVMYLPWGYDIAMVSGSIFYFMAGLFGVGFYRHKLLGINGAMLMVIMFYFMTVCFTVPISLRNVYESYKNGTGKMRPFSEAIRPIFPLILLALFSWSWAIFSPNNIIEVDTRCFFYLIGTMFSIIASRLVVAQMSDTRSDAYNWPLVFLAAAVGTCILVPGLPQEGELCVLYISSAGATLAHLHYGVCVIIQMCDHLKIKCFKITPRKDMQEDSSAVVLDDDASAGSEDRQSLELRRRT